MFDVTVRQHVEASPDAAGAVMFDPARDADWMGGAKRAVMETPPPYGAGSRVRREGGFLGRAIAWTTETTAYEPGRRAELTIVDGPFAGEVTYAVEPDPDGGAILVIRNRGRMPGMPDFLSRMVVGASVAGDLKRLKALIEAG
ncbi:MAG: SRPBCC family protein [Caulobacterales bacterium]|nr:SRPBCC family protein [Caulobacterales bacterium]